MGNCFSKEGVDAPGTLYHNEATGGSAAAPSAEAHAPAACPTPVQPLPSSPVHNFRSAASDCPPEGSSGPVEDPAASAQPAAAPVDARAPLLVKAAGGSRAAAPAAEAQAPDTSPTTDQHQRAAPHSALDGALGDMNSTATGAFVAGSSGPQGGPSATPQPAASSTPLTERYPYRAPTGQKCRVFISHAGEQKKLFVDIVREKLENDHPALKVQEAVFVDELSLHGCDDAMKEIYESLRDAFLVVLILSKEFISKKYPMEELQLLLHWRDTAAHAGATSAKLLPVFYDMSYEELGKQVDQYRTAAAAGLTEEELRKEQWAGDLAKLEQWLGDLKQLGGITGLRADQVSSAWGTKMRDKVVEVAVQLLCDMGQMPFRRPVEEPAIKVGLEAKVEQVVQLLTAQSNSRLVLVHGMGGIGKTTLARAVFNRLHGNNPTLPCCFLKLDPHVKEADIRKKQQQLLQDLAHVAEPSVTTAEDGRAALYEKLKGKRVLLVVDNVWDDALEFLLPKGMMQLLGEGSMVLVTSREQGAAKELGRVLKEEMDYLSNDESVELFCTYAFPELAPAPSSWGEHVKQSRWASQILAVLSICAGLPMALEVVGRYFAAGDDKEEFHSSFQAACSRQKAGRLEKERTLYGALRLSWGILRPEEQEALLDIALLLNGESWGRLRHHCGSDALRRLCGLGLLKKRENAAVEVHDPVIFFCGDATAIGRLPQRKVVHTGMDYMSQQEASNILGNRMLKGAACFGVRKVEVAFHRRLTDLRVLTMHECGDTRDDDCSDTMVLSLPKLRWLRLKYVGLTAARLILQGMTSLRVLSLMCFDLRGLETRNCPGLRVVELFFNLGGPSMVELGGATSLRELIIRDGWDGKGLHGVEHLRALTRFEVGFLSKSVGDLEELQLGAFLALEELKISRCQKLQRVPGLGALRALKRMEVGRCTQLHVLQLEGLVALEELRISGCDELQRVAALGALGALKRMEVKWCAQLEEVQLVGLTALEELNIRQCRKLHGVAGLGVLGALTSLQTDYAQNPEMDLRGLTALQTLRLGACRGLPRVRGLGELRALRLWQVSNEQLYDWGLELTEGSAEALAAYLKSIGVACSP